MSFGRLVFVSFALCILTVQGTHCNAPWSWKQGEENKEDQKQKQHERKPNLGEGWGGVHLTVKPYSFPVICIWIARVPRSPLDRTYLAEI